MCLSRHRREVSIPAIGETTCYEQSLSNFLSCVLQELCKRQWWSMPLHASVCRKIRAQNADAGSWIQLPGSRFLDPDSWIHAPGFRLLGPGSWIQAPGSRLLDTGSWIQVPGSRLLDPGSWAQARRYKLTSGLSLANSADSVGPQVTKTLP